LFDTPIRGCKTADDVTVEIDIAIVFRIMGDESKGEDPNLVRSFVDEMGPVELGRQLTDAQAEAVRTLARKVEHTEVYGLRNIRDTALRSAPGAVVESVSPTAPPADASLSPDTGEVGIELPSKDAAVHETKESNVVIAEEWAKSVTGAMKDNLNEQFNKRSVEIVDVAIQDVKLPKAFITRMQEKTTLVQDINFKKMSQESEMQKLRYLEEITKFKQAAKEEQEQRVSEGERAKAQALKELRTIKAQTKKEVDKIVVDTREMVRKIEADANLSIEKLNQERSAILAKTSAEASGTKAEVSARMRAFVTEKKSEADLAVIKNRALAFEARSRAEGDAAPKLRSKRRHEMRMKQLNVFGALAENREICVAGDMGDKSSLLADVLVSKDRASVMLNVADK